MSIFACVFSILDGVFHRNRMESGMDEEIRFHVARYADDLERSGIPRAEAERRARREFGPLEPVKEECRQARGWRLLDETAQDLRYAVRSLRRSPGFAAVSILTLATGIGANTAIFTIVDRWVLRPLPYRDAGNLISISTVGPLRVAGTTAPGDLYDWRSSAKGFEAICGWTQLFHTLATGGDPEQILGVHANAEFLPMLGVAPQLGRGFLPQDDLPGAAPVAILSSGLWHTRFGGSADMVGQTVQIDGNAVTVIGVLPADFHLPLAGNAGIWTPLALSAAARTDRRLRYLRVLGRLKPGISMAQAQASLHAVSRNLAAAYPQTNAKRGVSIETLRDAIGRQSGADQALIVYGLVACVLLMACFNVANLQLGRAVHRQKEMAVRLGIGAGRARLVRQLLTENVALFVAGAAASVVFGYGGATWIARAIPANVRQYLPNQGDLTMDSRALLYTLGVGAVTGLLFGFAPALNCRSLDVNRGLKEGVFRAAGSRVRNILVVAEVSLALVVLVASGLLVNGLLRMRTAQPGFEPHGVVTATVSLTKPRPGAEAIAAPAFFDAVVARLRATPGVIGAAASTQLPYSGEDGSANYTTAAGPVPPAAEIRHSRFAAIAPGYFQVLGIPLLRGRMLSENDRAGAPDAAIVNQTFARAEWPGQDPLGQRIRIGATLQRFLTVVGMVQDTEGQSDDDIPVPEFYMSYQQAPAKSMTLVVRAASPGWNASAEFRRAVASVDAAQAVSDVETMEQMMASERAPYTIVGKITACFAAIALFLAGIGIYGVMAYSVNARRREFGIRMALGAARGNILSLVVRQGFRLALAGIVIGLAAALGVTRLMAFMLYHVKPDDFPTFALTSVLLAAVAVLACYIPARRAASADPARVLRYE
jgi:putative ABC transport system permease protein